MAAAQRKTAVKGGGLKGAAKALLAAVSDLPDRQALERLTLWQAGEGPGLRRRALLAARIVLMRRLLAEPHAVEEAPALPEPTPEVVVPPVVEAIVEVVAAPAPKPARPAKAKMTTFSLEDAAKLLMTSAADEPDEPEAEAVIEAAAPGGESALDGDETPEATFQPAGWTHMAAQIDAPLGLAGEVLWQADATAGVVEVMDVDVAQDALGQMDHLPEETEADDVAAREAGQDIAPVPETPLPPYRKSQSTKVLQMDIGAQFAAMAEDDGPALVTGPKTAGLSAALDANLAALDGLEDLAQVAQGQIAPARAAAKPGKGKPVAVGDMGAQFAALDAMHEAEVAALAKAPAKPARTIDLSAQFAAMQDPDS